MPHSPDCWRIKTACYPDSRCYAGLFRHSPIPIVGAYLEIPSIQAIQGVQGFNGCQNKVGPFCSRNHAELSTVAGGACDVPTDAVGNAGRDTPAVLEVIRLEDSDLDPALYDPDTGEYFQAPPAKPRLQRQAADAWMEGALRVQTAKG